MDLKGVQKQLKDDIAQHQILMKQLKSSPEDSDLRKKLKEVQRHIAELGTIQKQIIKEKSQDQRTTTNQEYGVTKTILQNGFKKLLSNHASQTKIQQNSNVDSKNNVGNDFNGKNNDQAKGSLDFEKKMQPPNEKLLLKKILPKAAISPMHGVRIVNGQVKIRNVPSSSINPIMLIPSASQVSTANKNQIFRIVPNISKSLKLKPQLMHSNSSTNSVLHVANSDPQKRLLPAKLKQNKSNSAHKSPSPSPTFVSNTSRRKSLSDKPSPTKSNNFSSREEFMLQDMTDIVPQKNMFLMQLGLVTNARAAKFRARRYGKRRTCANPIYSGGIYVSHTSNDHNKRTLINDILEYEDIPAKKPRGRPKVGRKSPIQFQSSVKVSDEGIKLLESLKPINFPREDVLKRRSVTPVNSISHEDSCTVCGEAGEVLMCDTCSRVYHRKCLIPPLKRTPTDMWICDQCKFKFSDVSSAAQWPGLMSIVHSYFAYNSQRESALRDAQTKCKSLKSEKLNIEQKTKELTDAIVRKVEDKNQAKIQLQTNIELYSQLNFCFKNIEEKVCLLFSDKQTQVM